MNRNWVDNTLLLLVLVLFLASCSSRPYRGEDVATATFLTRSIGQQNNKLIVHAAVPEAAEALALTGLDLYGLGIQPIWLKVENTGTSQARVAIWSIDRDYFSPIEVAYMNRKKFSAEGYEQMQRWFYNNSLPRYIPPGETRSGLVFTHLKTGTKGFNLDIFSDQTAYNFTFFVPLPGFTADFMNVDFYSLYGKEETRDLNADELQTVLEQELPCCAKDPTGKLVGGPLNAVVVGTALALRRSMLRGDWTETSAGDEVGKFVVEHARKQRYRGRPPDAVFSKARDDGNETVYLQLWVTPWRIDAEPVWVGQTTYWSDEDTILGGLIGTEQIGALDFQSFFVRESVAADLDSAQRYLFQDFWYSGSLRKVGFVTGVGKATMEEPRESFLGKAYFTEGLRVVVFLSESPLGLDETEITYRLREALISEGVEP